MREAVQINPNRQYEECSGCPVNIKASHKATNLVDKERLHNAEATITCPRRYGSIIQGTPHVYPQIVIEHDVDKQRKTITISATQPKVCPHLNAK